MKIKATETRRELSAEEYLDLTREDAKRTVDAILKGFDFEKAARALRGCKWRYQGATASPTVAELKKSAIEITRQVIEMGPDCSIHHGPLVVDTKHYGHPAVVTCTLSLIACWKSAVYIDGRVIFAKKQVRLTGARKRATA